VSVPGPSGPSCLYNTCNQSIAVCSRISQLYPLVPAELPGSYYHIVYLRFIFHSMKCDIYDINDTLKSKIYYIRGKCFLGQHFFSKSGTKILNFIFSVTVVKSVVTMLGTKPNDIQAYLPTKTGFCFQAKASLYCPYPMKSVKTNGRACYVNSPAGSIYLSKYTTFITQRMLHLWYGVNVARKKKYRIYSFHIASSFWWCIA